MATCGYGPLFECSVAQRAESCSRELFPAHVPEFPSKKILQAYRESKRKVALARMTLPRITLSVVLICCEGTLKAGRGL